MRGEGIYYKVTSGPGAPLALESFVADSQQPAGVDPAPVLAAWQRRALFLSASVPRRRDDENDNVDVDSRRHLDDACAGWQTRLADAIADEQPRRIARATAWFCKFALAGDYTLVFGGHPVITPMVLEIARNYIPAGDEIRILVFQSDFYRNDFSVAARDLARWRHGAMLVTPEQPGGKVPSLTRMRASMFACPGLVAGVYIGGMSGLVEESRAFVRGPNAARRRRYAIGATGGAARFLLEQDEAGHAGRGVDQELKDALASTGSYPALMTRIFADLTKP